MASNPAVSCAGFFLQDMTPGAPRRYGKIYHRCMSGLGAKTKPPPGESATYQRFRLILDWQRRATPPVNARGDRAVKGRSLRQQ